MCEKWSQSYQVLSYSSVKQQPLQFVWNLASDLVIIYLYKNMGVCDCVCRNMHYPPETASIMLLAKMAAMVKQVWHCPFLSIQFLLIIHVIMLVNTKTAKKARTFHNLQSQLKPVSVKAPIVCHWRPCFSWEMVICGPQLKKFFMDHCFGDFCLFLVCFLKQFFCLFIFRFL